MTLSSQANAIKLVGNEAQIKWAKTIRSKRIEAIEKLNVRGVALCAKSQLTEKDMKDMGCNTMYHCHQFVTMVINHVIRCPFAVKWIKERDLHVQELIKESVYECLHHCKQKKPFKK